VRKPRLAGIALVGLVLMQLPALAAGGIPARDDAFLEDLEQRSFRYFWEQSDPHTGLTLDRAGTDGRPPEQGRNHYNVASIAATGFGLTGLCIAAERGWVSRKDARDRVRATLRFFAERAEHEHGWFYHWMDRETGERRWRSEISSIDTALLLGGVLTARQYFRDDREIGRLATAIYERIDFRWMLDGHPTLLSHGWYPESGFIKNRWRDYSEHLSLLLMAIGSPTHAIPPAAWDAWPRQWMTYAGYYYVNVHPSLFIHQYSHAWVDFRGRRESWYPYLDYFENSAKATRAHRQFCADLAREFPASYSLDLWGITASDFAGGYTAWGGPPRHPDIDGTLVPCAAGGSIMFEPELCVATLRTMREKFGERVYGRYGFVDAFNPTTGWVDAEVLGIDVGITLLSAENARTAFVWRQFMRNPEIAKAMDLVGLRRSAGRKRAA
jgi:hypothetical protein